MSHKTVIFCTRKPCGNLVSHLFWVIDKRFMNPRNSGSSYSLVLSLILFKTYYMAHSFKATTKSGFFLSLVKIGLVQCN